MASPWPRDSSSPAQGDQFKARSAAPEIIDHELLRVIGRGSYGEVWLARNILGEFRAVKVVYRRAFDNERPYERELEGIQRFEPISRAHPSQLNVLQVGRNTKDGYFYYVMELADDVGSGSEGESPEARPESAASVMMASESYTPHTLKSDLDQHARLPIEQCIRIGLALTTALEHLHAHGLVHRDVKPSNIIFVHGVPKLADIGLVASVDATMSFVGTRGFLPPEGPGTPQADLYSLGKVLYEASTGKDRQEFPSLPANLADWSDARRLVELNAVILKACAHDPRQRYQTAQEMAADLVLLQRGQSVKRLRAIERRLVVLTRAGLLAGGLLIIAAGLYWGARQQARSTARQLYVADMNHALASWEGGDVALARELLDTHRLRHPEMLGFEWRLIAQLCSESDAPFTLRGHRGTVWSLAFSPNSEVLATGGGDGAVKLWNTSSGNLVNTLAGHSDPVHAIAFSPDGRVLASGSRDFTVKLWDVASHTARATLVGHTDAVRSVSFSLDNQYLATAGEDKTLRWWSLARAQEIACVPIGFTIEQLVCSPDGRLLAGCGADNRVHFWSWMTHAEGPPLGLHLASVLGIAYSSDSRLLATGSYDGTIRLWDTVAGRELATLGRGAPVFGVASAPGQNVLATATADGLVRLWDIATRSVLTTLRGHTANVRALSFSPQGLLASGDEAGVVKLWTLPAAPGIENALVHSGIVNGLAFSPDGQTLASTDPTSDILRLWDLQTKRPREMAKLSRQAAWCLAFAPNGRTLLTGGVDGTVRMWNVTNLAASWILGTHAGGVDTVSYSPDGRYLASGSRDQTIRLWDGISGRPLATFVTANSAVRCVAFSPDGKVVGCAGLDGTVRLWDLATHREKARLSGHAGEIRCFVFSPDGKTLVSGGADRMIRVWNIHRQKLLAAMSGHTAMITTLAFSHDSKTLASGGYDSTVRLWNLRVFREVGALRAHSGEVTQVGFSPDDNTLASSSSDGTVRLWCAVSDTRTAVVSRADAVR
ncbi:MAG TPA: serine/threonine-protein kinase [Verrucomicrobiae bacterium]